MWIYMCVFMHMIKTYETKSHLGSLVELSSLNLYVENSICVVKSKFYVFV